MRAVALIASVSLGSLLADNSLAQDQLSFTRQDTSLGAFAGPHGCATGDFNGDGEADLVIPTSDTATLRILLGRGDGTFQAAPTLSIEQVANRVTVADLNDDGRQDLAATIFASSVVAIRLGNGDGTFQTAPDVSFDDGELAPSPQPTSMATVRRIWLSPVYSTVTTPRASTWAPATAPSRKASRSQKELLAHSPWATSMAMVSRTWP